MAESIYELQKYLLTDATPTIIWFSVNFLVTLIWWTIPRYINLCRKKYNLSPRMVIWPMKDFLPACYSCGSAIIAVTITGIFVAVPIMLWYTIGWKFGCKIVCGAIHKFVTGISFSKEEKVQIALGIIEKDNDDDNDDEGWG
ncbi:hypothetical protein LCGC14_1854790 [marine sediment metagenome]|uniref:Uncharacterized protein n=1 Tax=marine sediment metagenome TaxID=412755 RepID=A0A0F9GXL0_9ZZZZ